MLSSIFRDSDNVAEKRKRQIDTLKIFNDNVSEIKEDSDYKVEFISGANQLSLLVSLSPEFPQEKPVLKVAPAVKHPWVKETGEVTSAPGLLNFTVHSDLGRVVQAIVREFELRPPQLLSDNSSSPRNQREMGVAVASGSPLSPGKYSYSTSPSGQTQPYRDYTTHSPTSVSVAFTELNALSLQELQSLHDSPERLAEFADNLPVLRELDSSLEQWISSNEQLAKENLSKEPHMKELLRDVEDKHKAVAKLRASFESLSLEYQTLAEKFSPQSIRESIRLAAVKSDEESERIAERFLNGEMELESFLVAYIKSRMQTHCRKIKEEKLSHQLEELQRAGF